MMRMSSSSRASSASKALSHSISTANAKGKGQTSDAKPSASQNLTPAMALANVGNNVVIQSTSVPIVVKKDAWKKRVLLCHVDDPKLTFTGDSGAVGRITTDRSNITIDLKGRQYEGEILPSQTILLLNVAPPVAAKGSYRETARADVVSSEVCHLTFTKDVLSALMGEYTGAMTSHSQGQGEYVSDVGEGDDSSIASSTTGCATDRGKGKIGKNGEKGGLKQNPTISNVTNRKRSKVSKGKGGAGKRKK